MVFCSCGLLSELLVCDSFARNGIDKAIQPVKGVADYVALVKTPCKLIHVAPNVLGAGMVIDAVEATLEDCPDALDRVGGDTVSAILTGRVVDCIVAIKEPVHV